MAKPERGLGRGLDALFGGVVTETKSAPKNHLLIEEIIPNRSQPRKSFDENSLAELAESIRHEGVLQPLLVRQLSGGVYEIVAGERRWRAAQLAGLKELPVIIKHLTDEQALAIALIENLQREDLNPMEEALGFKELRDKFSLSQSEIAEKVGKSRSAVANTLRLLQLPSLLQEDIANNKITQGHARPLIGIEDESALKAIREAILVKDPSVREVELWVSAWKEQGILPGSQPGLPAKKISRGKQEMDPTFPVLEVQLREHLGVKATLRGNLERGSLKLSFTSKAELLSLLKTIGLTLTDNQNYE